MAATPNPVELRRLIATRDPADRRAAWRLVQQVPSLEPEYHHYLVETGQIEAGQRHRFLAIAGYEFELIKHSDGITLIELGEFEVDSDESLSDKLAANAFVAHDQAKPGQDTYTSWINQERFPFRQKGKNKVRLALLNTGKSRQCEAVFKAITTKLGRQEADHAHGLTVAQKYPNLQREMYMIMFGARGLDQRGDPAVLVLSSSSDKRWLDYYDVVDDWRNGHWALVAG